MQIILKQKGYMELTENLNNNFPSPVCLIFIFN